ncbi:hypothetical protein ABLE91_17015 [Aquabacter sp. CN5-332]|uniref:hypothetical protein n=1 Tax=Aquabacter sp. CN5-332 TaxID=3156608 RepID=UPI0032B5DBE5
MDATPLPDGLIALIKSTTRAAVAASIVPGSTGPQRVEQLTGFSAGQISRWQGDAHKDLAPLEAAFLLEFVSQKPVFARALAALTGHRLVPIEDGEGGGDFVADLVSVTSSAARLTAAYGAALADGQITNREREELRRELAQHHTALLNAERRLSGIPEAEDGAVPAEAPKRTRQRRA